MKPGVRTHISDDRLWLPYVAARFAKYCGDMSIFDEEAYYLEGEIRKGGALRQGAGKRA